MTIHDPSKLQYLMAMPAQDRDVKDDIDLTTLLAEQIVRDSKQKVYDSLVERHGTVLKPHQYEDDYITNSYQANLVWCTSRIDGAFGSFEIVRLPDGTRFYFSWSRDDIRDAQTS